MSYYDNVKNSVKENKDTGKPNFETLRKAAQESSESEDEKKGDDTEIEVLEDGLNNRSRTVSKSSDSRDEPPENGNSQISNKGPSPSETSVGSDADLSGVEQKLDRIIEQNRRMIEILESFGS